MFCLLPQSFSPGGWSFHVYLKPPQYAYRVNGEQGFLRVNTLYTMKKQQSKMPENPPAGEMITTKKVNGNSFKYKV